MHSCFKVYEGLDLQPPHSADKRKIPYTAMNIVFVKQRETLWRSKTGIAKGSNQRRQLIFRKLRPGRDGNHPQIQHGVIESALPARMGQRLESFLARPKIEELVGVKADKLT